MKKRLFPVVERLRSALRPTAAVVLVEPERPRGAPSLQPFDEYLFDAAYYGAKYPEALLEVRHGRFASLREHYEKRGHVAGHRPSPVFVPSVYAMDARSGFGAAGGIDPVTHYLTAGCRRQASPHFLFDEVAYLAENADVGRAVEDGTCASGFHHYLAAGMLEGRWPHRLFNPALYEKLNGQSAGGASFLRYVRTGVFEGQVTTGLFDAEWYAFCSPDVPPHVGESRGLDCLLHHFIQFGMKEGRSPSPDFDAEFYLRRYPEVRAEIEAGAVSNPVEHWIMKGAARGFSPNAFFDPAYYLHENPEVTPEISELQLSGPFEHFVLFGHARGLRCNPPLVQLPADEEHAKVTYARRARTAALLARVRVPSPKLPADVLPDVSIVVPVRDQGDFTFHLLSDLLSRRTCARVEIIVVDNGSRDSTRDLPAVFPEITLIRNEENVGFPAACNQGFRASRGRIVVFANNDVEVLPGAVDAMMRVFDTHANVAAVGPRVIRMHGRLQEVGGTVFPDGSTAGHGRNDDPDAPRYGWLKDVHYCSAVFLGVRRSVLEALGGFDEAFSPGYYEEVDLCARIWSSGHRVVVEPAAVVYHFEHATFVRGRPPSAAAATMHRHRKVFVEKAGKFLSECQPRLPSNPGGGVGFAPAKKSVLLIEDFLPLPSMGSGFPRANRIVHALTELGHHVVVYALFRHPLGNWTSSRAELPPVEVHYDDEAPGVLAELLATRAFDAVWVCRTHNLERVLHRVSGVKSSKKRPTLILDTEALSANRAAALRALNAEEASATATAEQVRAELAGADTFDCIVAVNEIEQRQIARALRKSRVVVVGHETSAPVTNGGFGDRNGYLFVGAVHAELSPNHEGLLWLLQEVWPEIRSRDPEATLTVAGYWAPQVRRPEALSSPGVQFLGEVPDLGPLYGAARVFVAPVRFAAGIPLKVQEAVSRGVPCVLTDLLAGQVGLEDGKDCSTARSLSPVEFAKRCVELHQSPALWERLREGGLAHARREWSKARFVSGIAEALGMPTERGHLLS